MRVIRPFIRLARFLVLGGMLLLGGIFAIAVHGIPPATAQSATYVAGTEDIPLMAGLTPVPGSMMVFETSKGRLLESYGVGHVSAEAILNFYRRTLPQLGWREVANQTFVRERESLEIGFTPSPEGTTVRFALSPL